MPSSISRLNLDSSYNSSGENSEENQWLNQENIPGLKKLKENIRLDLGILEKVIPASASLLDKFLPSLLVVSG